MFRHGLRVSEACALQLDQVDVESRVLHVARLKKGLSTNAAASAEELRVIKAWPTDLGRVKPSCRAFFVSRKRQPLNRRSAWFDAVIYYWFCAENYLHVWQCQKS
jgi:type 1 fimbriae regulatory protein FimB